MTKIFTFSGSIIKEFKNKILLECGIDFNQNANNIENVIIGFDSKELDPVIVWNSIPPEYHHIIFTKNELNSDIKENSMTTKHSIEDPRDHLDRDRYPTIFSYDPMVRKINARLGDIIRIDDYYRVVRF